MRIRTVAVPSLLTLTAVLAGACSDASPTAPLGVDAEFNIFGPPVGTTEIARTLDRSFVSIAEAIPGFGGVYYDESGALNVVMSGVQPLSLRAISEPLAELGVEVNAQPVRVVAGEYDFIQLDAMHRSAMPVLGLSGVVFTDADEMRNRVVIGVEDAVAAAAVERSLRMSGVPRSAVIIETAEPIVPLQTLQQRVRPVAGGLQINFTAGASAYNCTLGFNVRAPQYPNVHGFVTNSHCTATRGVVLNTPYWQHSRSSADNFIGTEAHDAPFFQGGVCPAGRNCRYSDAAGVRYESGVDNRFGAIYRTTAPSQHTAGPLTIDAANPRWQIVSETPFPIVGEVAHKTGRTTGWLVGPVIGTCQMTSVAGEGNINVLCQDRVQATAQGGDSGSPVFRRIGDTNDVSLMGILWGGSSGSYVFSSMANIRCENQGVTGWTTYPGQTPPPPAACPGR